jgi:adenine C2-methylase RlmN of 23S rRNA A2503 and tRNA A37
MDEATRQRLYLEGLRLIEEAFNTLREPLDIDEQAGEERPEVQLALQLTAARNNLRELIRNGNAKVLQERKAAARPRSK